MQNHVAPVADVMWVDSDGICYLCPEIVLVYKARLRRPEDDPDFLEATLPVLSEQQRRWMLAALADVARDHPWMMRL